MIKYPLSDIVNEIDFNGEKFIPIDWFEIGDDYNESLEFDFGNIKLINTLKQIAKYNIKHDINFLPYYVVKKLKEWNFDIE